VPRVLNALLASAAVLAATVALLLGGESPAAAAACKTVMTFEFDPSSGNLVLSPSKVTVDAGACVTFQNETITPAQFTVGTTYKASAPAFGAATPDYIARAAGSTQPVTASGAAGSAHGSIVIRPAAQPSSSPTAKHASSSAPAPRHHRPRPAPRPSSAGPLPVPTASPPPTGPAVSPPPGSTPFLAGMPTPSPTPSTSSSPAAVVAGPLQPPSGRGTGLPAAVAALAVVATAAGLMRVLLAEPTGRPSVGGVDDGRGTVGASV